MGRDRNIFFNVVNNENQMSELLCNYMSFRARRLTNNSIANKCSKWLDFKIS